jgi:hypothetical protein
MARLILLNGPPGCGKSTMAQMYVNDHPLALNLDIDRVRSLLGGWRADPQAAGLLARAIALAAARVHLSSCHDVIVPQHLGRAQFIEQLERLAQEVGADVREPRGPAQHRRLATKCGRIQASGSRSMKSSTSGYGSSAAGRSGVPAVMMPSASGIVSASTPIELAIRAVNPWPA